VADEWTTDRLALRRLTPEDAPNLLKLDGDPLVMRYIESRVKLLSEIQTDVLPKLMSCHIRHPGLGYWAAEKRADGTFVGWFGLRPVMPSAEAIVHWAEAPSSDGTGVAELGYRLCRDAWGHGYATEGVQALVRRAFAEPGIREIVATTMAVNTASRRVMEKAGLTLVRTIHLEWANPLDGTEHGEVEYRLRI
jgi:RimJ/RimL family protein N-acetyltransferase